MIKYASTKPHDRLNKIKSIMDEFKFKEDKHLKDFGISIADEPLQVDGRVLPVPEINGVSILFYRLYFIVHFTKGFCSLKNAFLRNRS